MGCRHKTLDIVAQIYDHTFFLHPSDRAGGLDTRGKALDNLGPWIIGQLLDSEGDPLRLRIDVQHQDLYLIPLLDDFRRMLDPPSPTQIGDVDESVDPRFDFDERAEGGEVPDHSGQLRAGRVFCRKGEPGILFDLLHSERDLLVLHVDLQHHCFDLVGDIHELGRVSNVARPRHLGDVNEALDALLQLDEGSVVRDRHDLPTNPGTDRVLLVDVGPRVRQKLLEAQRDTLAVPIDVQDLYVEIRADIHDLGGMSHPPPRHVGDVEQAVESAQIDKRAEVGDVLDDSFPDLPDQELLDQSLALSLTLSLEDDAARDHDVPPTLVELDDLELERLSEKVVDVWHTAQRDLRARQERVDTHDVHRDAALDLARQHSFHRLIGLMSLANLLPNTQEVGLLLREHDDPVVVLQAFEKNLDLLARRDRITVLELVERNRSLALEAEFQDDHAVGHPEHFRVDDFAFPEVPHHIRVIGEQRLEVRRGYVEDFLPVRIRQQLGGDTAWPFFGHRYGCRNRGRRGLPVGNVAGNVVGSVVAGDVVSAVAFWGCFGSSSVRFTLGGCLVCAGFGGGVLRFEVWVVGHGSLTGAVRRCLVCRTLEAAPRSGLRDREKHRLRRREPSVVKLYVRLKRSQVLYPPQNEGYLIIEWQPRGVHLQGMLRPPQGRVTPTPIGLVALVDAPRLFLNFGHIRLASMILEQPAPGALLEAGDKKNFYVRVGENHGTHIPSVGHEVTVSSHAALYVEQPITNGG